MTNITITVDRDNGKLLLIAKDDQKKFMVRNAKAAEIIKDLSKRIKIKETVEDDNIYYIKCNNLNIAVDSSDKRIFNYKEAFIPLVDKIDKFEQKQAKKNVASKVKRENTLSRRKVVSSKQNPRSEEYKKTVRKFNIELLEKIINNKVTETAMKGIVSVLGFALLVYGSLAVYHLANGDYKKVQDVETAQYLEASTIEETYPEITDQFVITKDDNIYVAPEEVEEDKEYCHVEMDSSEVRFYKSKADKCRELYGDYINEIAEKYGVPADLLLSIATQENGVHEVNEKRDAKGLFQIRASIYVGYEIRNFNYITNEWEKHTITLDDLTDERKNIETAGRITQENYLNYSKRNPVAGSMCYHFGPGGLNSIAKKYIEAKKTVIPELELTSGDVLANQSDYEWLNYVNKISGGYDLSYLQRILTYYRYFAGDEFEIKFRNPDGTVNVSNIQMLGDRDNTMSFNVSSYTDIYNNTDNYNR